MVTKLRRCLRLQPERRDAQFLTDAIADVLLVDVSSKQCFEISRLALNPICARPSTDLAVAMG